MSEKIQSQHLGRAAYVYVRQSTMHQVREHQESRRRQYALKERATELGFARVVVIDQDLGRSGSGSQARPGFSLLLEAVCQGEVGAVLALEASRLARNSRDWHHLLDLCALTDTLVVDHDGVYDPRVLNDRLLLGLKGTMSEFELGLLRQRAQEALRNMIQRGEVLTAVPVGYVRTRDNRCEMSPDLEVQGAVRAVFTKFTQLGSVRQTLLWYRQERIPVPCTRGPEGEIAWRLPGYSRILSILKNPIYAGAFVYGRRRTKTVVVEGRARKTSGHDLPLAEWGVVLRDRHAAFISWEQFLHNQKVLEANAGMRGAMSNGAPKTGPALLAGLLRCARCGRKLHVGYSGVDGRVPRYFCRGGHLNHGVAWCISVGGLRVDRAVETEVLRALDPVGVQAALDAWEQMTRHEDEKAKALRLELERTRYEAERARKQYHLVDPENRLVASELERRWNEALEKVHETEERLKETASKEPAVGETERTRLLELGGDLRQLWEHRDAPAPLKKRVLRTVLQEIIADIEETPPQTVLRLHWTGGVHTVLKVPRNRTGQHGRSTDIEVVELVGELSKVGADQYIAGILNRLGYETGAGNTWTESRVRGLRIHRQIAPFDATAKTWMSLEGAAEVLGVSPSTVRRMIVCAILPAKQVVRYAPWVIARVDLDLPAVRRAAATIKVGGRLPRSVPGQATIPFPSTM